MTSQDQADEGGGLPQWGSYLAAWEQAVHAAPEATSAEWNLPQMSEWGEVQWPHALRVTGSSCSVQTASSESSRKPCKPSLKRGGLRAGGPEVSSLQRV